MFGVLCLRRHCQNGPLDQKKENLQDLLIKLKTAKDVLRVENEKLDLALEVECDPLRLELLAAMGLKQRTEVLNEKHLGKLVVKENQLR